MKNFQIQLILVFLKMILKKLFIKKTNELKQYFSMVTKKQNFDETLVLLATAKNEVFDFFDNVKVNDDSEVVKKIDWNY